MRKHTLTLTLALATAPALAADWAHNDPDKASTGKVQIWDGSKTVTVNSAPTTAVATMGGGTALGQVVASKLTLAKFIEVNDLEASNWKDVTWRGGGDTLSIAGTELANKSGLSTYDKIKMPGAPRVDTYYSLGKYSFPAGSTYEFSSSDGYEIQSWTETYGRNDNTRTKSNCFYWKATVQKSGGAISIRQKQVMHIRNTGSAHNRCEKARDIRVKLVVTSPVPPAQPNINYFLKVND